MKQPSAQQRDGGRQPSDGHGKPRIVLADDDRVILSLIRHLLTDDYDVVGQAEDGRGLVELVTRQCPDLAIVDISMPGMNGIEATRQIMTSCPDVRVILLSVHDEQAYVDAAFEAGACGYVLKLAASAELIPAVETVCSDGRYLSSRLR